MTNRYTRNSSRIQPTPPVCKSKPAETLPAQHLPGQLAVVGIMIYSPATLPETQQQISSVILPTPWGDGPPVVLTLADGSSLVWQMQTPTYSLPGAVDVTVTSPITGTTIARADLPPTFGAADYDSYNRQLKTPSDLIAGTIRVTIQ